jgi:hypothetical protein
MNNKRIIILIVCLSLASICISSNIVLETNVIKTDLNQQFTEAILKGKNKQEREAVANTIRTQQEKLIDDLIMLAMVKLEEKTSKTIQDSNYVKHYTKYMSIILLGELRATKAITVLLDNIEYINPDLTYVGSLPGIGQLYKAAESLSKIGIPAVEPTIEKLGIYEPNSTGSNICCWILKEILGEKLARYKLQLTIEETKDENVKKKLTTLLPNFKTEQEKAVEEYAQRKKDLEKTK